MDFTQAFHSGDKIQRRLFAEQPREGIPGMQPGQLLRLDKTCYGLTDGPRAWFIHLKNLLCNDLGYQVSLADPCIYYKLTADGQLGGVIGVATDDLLHGGDEEHTRCMEQIRQRYKLGKYQYDAGRFTGKNFQTLADGSIKIHQEHYTRETIKEIPLTRARRKQRYSHCTPEEVTLLRASVGALAWLSKETRPELAGRVSLLQQCFPTPRIRDIVEANSLSKEAQGAPESGIRVMPIPLENLRIGVATDASWANAKTEKTLDKNKEDFWEELETSWVRHHTVPRQTLFHPGAVPGPDLHSLLPSRRTISSQDDFTDTWNSHSAHQIRGDTPWTGRTVFQKQPTGHALDANQISDSFLQMMQCNSQGGFVLLFYDKRLEYEDQPHMVSVTAWKSLRLKRKTVNTLSAECQSMIHGVGHIHWHRYLLLELLGHDLKAEDWEVRLSSIPFVSVVDSKSLFDCLNKQMCTFSQLRIRGQQLMWLSFVMTFRRPAVTFAGSRGKTC